MTLPERIAQFLEAEEKSTGGIWNSGGHSGSFTGVESSEYPQDWVISPDDDYEVPKHADVDFIVLAKNLAPQIIRDQEAIIRVLREALEWIDKPDHYEPDQYTQTACFQHRAYNALAQAKALEEKA